MRNIIVRQTEGDLYTRIQEQREETKEVFYCLSQTRLLRSQAVKVFNLCEFIPIPSKGALSEYGYLACESAGQTCSSEASCMMRLIGMLQ